MPNVAAPLQSDNSVSQASDGSVVLSDPDDMVCCCIECAEVEAIDTILRNGAQHNTFPGFPGGRPPYANQLKCHRLFVWERRAVVAGVYGGADAADWILKTNRRGCRTLGCLPFETTPTSGILLDAEPYWWACIGGWEDVASMHYELTLAQVQALMTGPAVDGTYSLCALVRYNHWEETVAQGGGVLIAVGSGQVKLKTVQHVKHG